MIASHPRDRRGVTLIEMVVVLLIIGVSSAVAIPVYSSALADYRALQAAQRIASDLTLARWTARSNSSTTGITVTFTPAALLYSIPGVVSLTETTPDVVLLGSDPYDLTLMTVSFTNGSAVTFDRYGQPSTGGTITVQAGSTTRTVTLDPTTGLATVQ